MAPAAIHCFFSPPLLFHRPFLLRRIKTDVETSLPSKKEILLYAQMTPLQKKLDKQLRDKTLQVRRYGDEMRASESERERECAARAFLSFLRSRRAPPVPPFAPHRGPHGSTYLRAPSAPQVAHNERLLRTPAGTYQLRTALTLLLVPFMSAPHPHPAFLSPHHPPQHTPHTHTHTGDHGHRR